MCKPLFGNCIKIVLFLLPVILCAAEQPPLTATPRETLALPVPFKTPLKTTIRQGTRFPIVHTNDLYYFIKIVIDGKMLTVGWPRHDGDVVQHHQNLHIPRPREMLFHKRFYVLFKEKSYKVLEASSKTMKIHYTEDERPYTLRVNTAWFHLSRK